MTPPVVIAVLGKGGTGKTVVSALVARALLDGGARPLLLVDADPAGGLGHALGEDMRGRTLGDVREKLVAAARDTGADRDDVSRRVDWMALDVLRERGRWSLLSMGRTETKGCFCPVNSLLRDAVGKLAAGFAWVVLDAEAGVEQVNRQVAREVDVALLLTDGSRRGLLTLRLLDRMVRESCPRVRAVGALLVRAGAPAGELPDGVELWARVPHDPLVARFDREGRPLLELPARSAALRAVRAMVEERLAPGAPAK